MAKRRASKAVVRYRTRVVAKARRTGRRAFGAAKANKVRIGTTVAAAAYGYLSENNSSSLAFMDKLPGAAQVGKELAWGLAAHFAYKHYKKPWLDHAATALMAIGAYKFGQGGFKISGDDDLGYDDAIDVSGDDDLR